MLAHREGETLSPQVKLKVHRRSPEAIQITPLSFLTPHFGSRRGAAGTYREIPAGDAEWTPRQQGALWGQTHPEIPKAREFPKPFYSFAHLNIPLTWCQSPNPALTSV